MNNNNVIRFPVKKNTWQIMLRNFDQNENRLGYLRGLLEGLIRKEASLDSGCSTSIRIDLKNKITDVERLIKK